MTLRDPATGRFVKAPEAAFTSLSADRDSRITDALNAMARRLGAKRL